MELVRIDTQRAYGRIRELITSLQLEPGAPINEQRLAAQLDMGAVPVREALKLLAHENLVTITPRHGLYVSDVNIHDLEQLSEMRLMLEGLAARLAALRATPDDVVILEALREELASIPAREDLTETELSRLLLDVDHRFHQAIARAAHNRYLAEALERGFGSSQRLWYLAMPHLGFLPPAVEEHLALVEAIKASEAGRAEQIMRHHVQAFYDNVREVLLANARG